MFTIPIIVFYATDAKASSNGTSSLCMEENTTALQGLRNGTLCTSGSGINRTCATNFYFDQTSDLCRPECGEWDQYPQSTRAAVYGVNIAFVVLTILICAVTLVWLVFRYKIMFRFPNIALVYITVTRIVLSIAHVVGYTDEKALYCTSRDRVASFENGSPYCSIIGSITTFVPSHDLTLLCFHLGTVLFAAYFPFRARVFQLIGRYKYVHIAAVASAMLFSAFLVGVQFALGGYSRTMVPTFCLADASSAFVFGVIPVCIISATFLTLVMLLLFKIVDIGGWKFRAKKTEESDGPSRSYTTAHMKLILTFCAYGITNIVNFSAYSVVLKREAAFSQELQQYFDCESMGVSFGKSCDRDAFERLDPTEFTFPFTTISYMLMPIATLIYVANVEKFIKKCRQKKPSKHPLSHSGK